MSTAEQLRNKIIDELLTINDADQLANLKKVITEQSNHLVKVSFDQKEALLKSEEDISAARLYSNEEVEKDDQEWL